jgi:hypothetical protein
MKRIKEAISRLNEYYFKNDIVYPRVNNNYLGQIFDFFAHPPLNRVDFYTLPLLKEEYPLNKETILLYLHNKGLVTPSLSVNIYKFLNTTFNLDDEKFLIPLNRKYLNGILDKFLTFCEKENITFEGYNRFNASNFPQKYIISVRLKPTPETIKAKKELKKEKENRNYATIKKKFNEKCFKSDAKVVFEEDNFFDFLEKFKKKRKLLKEIC